MRKRETFQFALHGIIILMDLLDFLTESGFAPTKKYLLFDGQHIFALFLSCVYGVLLAISLSLLSARGRWLVLIIIACLNTALLFLRLANYIRIQGRLQKDTQLPFHLCGMNVILMNIAILSASPALISVAFGLSPLPALSAILFPESDAARYPRFKFRSLEYFFSHSNLILLPIYAVVFLDYEPSLAYFPAFAGVLFLMSVVAAFVNRKADGNYMFLAWGPEGTPLAFLHAKAGTAVYRIFMFALITAAYMLSYAIWLLFA